MVSERTLHQTKLNVRVETLPPQAWKQSGTPEMEKKSGEVSTPSSLPPGWVPAVLAQKEYTKNIELSSSSQHSTEVKPPGSHREISVSPKTNPPICQEKKEIPLQKTSSTQNNVPECGSKEDAESMPSALPMVSNERLARIAAFCNDFTNPPPYLTGYEKQMQGLNSSRQNTTDEISKPSSPTKNVSSCPSGQFYEDQSTVNPEFIDLRPVRSQCNCCRTPSNRLSSFVCRTLQEYSGVRVDPEKHYRRRPEGEKRTAPLCEIKKSVESIVEKTKDIVERGVAVVGSSHEHSAESVVKKRSSLSFKASSAEKLHLHPNILLNKERGGNEQKQANAKKSSSEHSNAGGTGQQTDPTKNPLSAAVSSVPSCVYRDMPPTYAHAHAPLYPPTERAISEKTAWLMLFVAIGSLIVYRLSLPTIAVCQLKTD